MHLRLAIMGSSITGFHSELSVHLLVKTASGEPLTNHVVPLDAALRWLNESCGAEAQWAEMYAGGALLLTLRRGEDGRWWPRGTG